MNVLEIRDSIIQYWLDNYRTTPTQYENSDIPDILTEDPFVVLEIEFVKSTTVGTGTPEGTKTRHRGFIVITINVPKDSGNRTSYVIANEALQLLERKRINQSVATYSGYLGDKEYHDSHYAVSVFVPFIITVG